MIKDKTKCKIVVGQNGLVWVKGDEDMEQLTKNIIHLIEAEAHTSGLTNKIKNKLYLAIDGELPPEEEPQEEEEFVLEKPKLQNFKEELEQEEREAEEKRMAEEEEPEEDKQKEDKPNIAEVIEELKKKNNKDHTLSYGDNSNNSFILNNK
jgi:exosome complex component RRP4